jgi:hypothetical protein
VALPDNLPAQLASARELGPVPPGTPMASMILALRMPAAAQARLQRRLAGLQDPESKDYHRWLTPEQFGAEFGPAPENLDRVCAWLRAGGFSVDEVAAGRLAITFSGTAAQVERAFRTRIRSFELDGRRRQGNAGAPSIPAALAGVVEGLVSLHDLPRPALNTGFRGPGPSLAPAGFAAIYGAEPLYREGIDGSGVAVAIPGRSRIPLADIADFRARFGLPARTPEIILNGPDPGDLGGSEAGEAALDVEWAGAAAPGADLRFVASSSTATTDGVDLSAQYIVNHDLAPILSISFGQCEPYMGAAELAFYRNLWTQAAAQGITVLAAAGDSGPAGCDGGAASSGSGQAVSGLASTPYDTAVGGTEFAPGVPGPGYRPERAWNESADVPGGAGLWAGGGGQSMLYPRPGWQAAPGVPAGANYRCLPDVALAAALHDGYAIVSEGRQQVTGGTSCSCPAFAGLMALVVQKTGARQGNANPALYRLAAAQYQGGGPAVFHDVLAGNTDVPGTPGYPCTPGYDLATGLGSVDARALAAAWTAGLGRNLEAVIARPAADRTVANGACVPFQGAVRGGPGPGLTFSWDFGDGVGGSGLACHHTYRNPGPNPVANLVTFTARDDQGAQGSDTRLITVQPPPAPGELIRNGSFESASSGWTSRGVSVGDNSPMAPPHQGNADAWFPASRKVALLQQTVTIPAGAGSARLSFWLHADTGEPGAEALDTFQVKARGPDGKLAILATFSNLDAGPGYRQRSLSLRTYLGQRVQLSLVASPYRKGGSTSFVLDDVSLIAK